MHYNKCILPFLPACINDPPMITDPTNNHITMSSYTSRTVGSAVTYTCNAGYYLNTTGVSAPLNLIGIMRIEINMENDSTAINTNAVLQCLVGLESTV